MRKKLKWAGVIAVVLLIGAQFLQPERTNPALDESKEIRAALEVPVEVRAVLERSCYDCHSNQTKWPWYSYVAPASWLVSYDVKKGRRQLNFSVWGDYKKNRQINKLEGIADQVSQGEMPLKKYVVMHPAAALSKTEIDLISKWAEKERDRLSEPDSTEIIEK